MNPDWINSFRNKLDQHHRWPSTYMFKFIVPNGKVDELKNLFAGQETSERPSANGKYISITIQLTMPSSDAVIEIYTAASKIEGLIAL